MGKSFMQHCSAAVLGLPKRRAELIAKQHPLRRGLAEVQRETDLGIAAISRASTFLRAVSRLASTLSRTYSRTCPTAHPSQSHTHWIFFGRGLQSRHGER